MTKKEMMKKFEELQDEKQVRIEGIYWNSNKATIQNAIDCLECSDEMLEKYLIVISLKYPNIYNVVANNGDFKKHSYNRLHIYNMAKSILA